MGKVFFGIAAVGLLAVANGFAPRRGRYWLLPSFLWA